MSEKKIVLVTGCSQGGIGFALCEKLGAHGFTVYCTARSLDSMKDLDHPNFTKLTLDVTDDVQVGSVVSTIIAAEGHIDFLINNAGVLAPGSSAALHHQKSYDVSVLIKCSSAIGPVIDWTAEEMKAVFDANVFSILRLCRAVIPHMAKRKQGTIVNMGSVVGEFPTPWTGIYDASKAADNYELPPNSIYGTFFHNIRQQLEASRGPDAIPTDALAEVIISKALRHNPPAYILTGGKAGMFRVFAFLPQSWYLSIIWNMFSKPEEKSKRLDDTF
ncbi:hypothetical protein EVG20_g10935 [Dentipellis fragilis]|uniref:Uncharacterized protein n=1 Tax=Dentipellis fragilis TaxID=205917 RepID=A0A4Y9XSS4_9AGAM|nr:hypothetical protein EVG20_g10935 [Dentipellis fragilis]